ncbi:1-deoxy-D-xylulose-5-phosphate synthase [Pygmaiobacter massiliensis]|uniref:1-deoxy-D-xylulose-5-phosphate synthase n=1 Tax=Pygmaiobacter massiliensis TaxID=1917873 RepID=UPI000C7E5EDE|nr:1-deoxy-D-xylulose-5-phosphate synthase [Pygmaiobacter massiliensis]
MSGLLNTIVKDKSQLKQLSEAQLTELCAEIRRFLIEHVSKTGGHLSSNLCMVELTVALHRVFNTPQDNIVFDVGHQCYTHKILTGRADRFETLRQLGGLSGFPNPTESEHDSFIAGHGNTAISAAIGIARAKKLKHEPGTVVAVVGDGAFTGGMVYEGINNIDKLDNLIVILNDNKMSISKNVGAVSRYFTRLRTSKEYHSAKHRTENMLDHLPIVGQGIKSAIVASKTMLRRTIYNSTFFEEMGFQYIGPLDGHDLEEVSAALESAKEYKKPLFLHAVTVKGKGFTPAEQNPGAFHGVSAFDTAQVPDPDDTITDSFSEAFGKKVTELAGNDTSICAITAAMKYATGLHHFKKAYRERFFDVGMAEQHSVTFAAGLAAKGMYPVVALYSTFLQRSFDQLIHDVNLQNSNLLIAIDRAGLVPGDGETHQGIYDVAFFSGLDRFPLYAPLNYAELDYWLEQLVRHKNGPAAIRYPKGAEDAMLSAFGCDKSLYRRLAGDGNAETAFVTYGAITAQALKAVQQCENNGQAVDLYNLVRLAPIPAELVEALRRYPKVVLAEDAIAHGSVGTHLGDKLLAAGYHGIYRHRGLPTTGIDHASVPELQKVYGLAAAELADFICG